MICKHSHHQPIAWHNLKRIDLALNNYPFIHDQILLNVQREDLPSHLHLTLAKGTHLCLYSFYRFEQTTVWILRGSYNYNEYGKVYLQKLYDTTAEADQVGKRHDAETWKDANEVKPSSDTFSDSVEGLLIKKIRLDLRWKRSKTYSFLILICTGSLSLSLSGGFTPCRHLRPFSGREHTIV